jgi:peptide deformylase
MSVLNIVKYGDPILRKKCQSVVNFSDLPSLVEDMFDTMYEEDGIGLAANQVGIDAQVAVVNVREPIILINPKYIDKGNEIPYYEGCLSFHGKGVNTRRYDSVIIKTEQEESNWYFSGATNPIDGKGSWEKTQQNKNDAEMRLLETICVQHEIDHLNGVTIMDRQMVTTITKEKQIGRNDPCHCGSGKKYKKCCL